jgi:hypothetical protein
MSNREEFYAGTNPTNALSYLSLDIIRPSAFAGAILSFTAMSNKNYTVQFANQSGYGPWINLTNLGTMTTNRTNVLIQQPVSGNRTNLFYRVVTPMQP